MTVFVCTLGVTRRLLSLFKSHLHGQDLLALRSASAFVFPRLLCKCSRQTSCQIYGRLSATFLLFPRRNGQSFHLKCPISLEAGRVLFAVAG